MPANDRIAARFAKLRGADKAGFVAFVTSGDPDADTSQRILQGLPGAGADIIELGMPFSDPMADGPAIQAASLRALKSGASLKRTLSQVRDFRRGDTTTPIVLMGYYNPIYVYGVDRFLVDAIDAGVDGLIVVDLPPEEDDELCLPALDAGLHFIRLATPTTDDARLPAVLAHTSGFIYYVSIAGITGTKSADSGTVLAAVARLRRHTGLPIAVGFGIDTPDKAAVVARAADACVVGSALVRIVAEHAGSGNSAKVVDAVLARVSALARAVHTARTNSGV